MDAIFTLPYSEYEVINVLKKKLKTDIPNTKLMTIGFILKLKELKAEPKSYKYLLQNVSQEDKKNYSL